MLPRWVRLPWGTCPTILTDPDKRSARLRNSIARTAHTATRATTPVLSQGFSCGYLLRLFQLCNACVNVGERRCQLSFPQRMFRALEHEPARGAGAPRRPGPSDLRGQDLAISVADIFNTPSSPGLSGRSNLATSVKLGHPDRAKSATG